MKKILSIVSVIVCLESGTMIAAQRQVPSIYPTIGAAISAAASGDSIIIAAGSYSESVSVSKALVIIGSGASTVITPPSGNGIIVSVSNVVLQSLRVAHASSNGISASDVTNLTLINVSADSNNVSGAQLTRVTGTSIVTNFSAVGNKIHGLSIGAGSANISVNGGTFNSNGTGRGDGTGAGININASGVTLISNISIQGPLTANNNTTAGIWANAASASDTIKGVTVGSTGAVTLTNNGGSGVILLGCIKDATITGDFTKSAAFASGILIVGINFSGAASPIGTTIRKSTFGGYQVNQPAISLSAGVYPYTSVNPVIADSNTFVGATRTTAIDSMIYDKLDDTNIGLVTHTHDNFLLLPSISLNRVEMTFGEVRKDTSVTQSMMIRNFSANTLVLDSLFTRTPWFSAGIAKGIVNHNDSLSVSVSFSPDSIRSYADTLFIANNSLTAIVMLPLNGNSPVPTLSVDKGFLSFGGIGIYDTATIAIKVANSSLNLLAVDSVYTSTAFFQAPAFKGNVKKGDTLGLGIRFIPGRFGDFVDTLFLKNSSTTSLKKIPLSGSSPSSVITIAPSLLDFGSLKVDSTRQLLFTIRNSSISVLQVESLYTINKRYDVHRTLANPFVKSGDTITVSIRFTPDTVGQFFDTLIVVSTAPSSPTRVPLKGIGIPTTLVPIFATGIPTSFALFQNYPNPFNPATRIRFAIPKQSQVKIEVLNIIGQKIAVVVDREVAAGAYEVNWQANGASGIYFYRIEATPSDARENRFVEVRKMILLK